MSAFSCASRSQTPVRESLALLTFHVSTFINAPSWTATSGDR